jgi:hypothetical protein
MHSTNGSVICRRRFASGGLRPAKRTKGLEGFDFFLACVEFFEQHGNYTKKCFDILNESLDEEDKKQKQK